MDHFPVAPGSGHALNYFNDRGSDDPDALRFGRVFNRNSRQIEGWMRYGNDQGMLLLGPSGKGKGTRILMPNLLQCQRRSFFVVDPKGELAAVTARYRRTLGPVYVINPFGVIVKDFPGYDDLRSCGYNPLFGLDPRRPEFSREADMLAAALVTRESKDPHWTDSARNLIACALMWEVLCARRENRTPDMGNLRVTLSTPSAPDRGADRPPIGIPALARQWMRTGLPALAAKAGQFVEWTQEKPGIVSTALTQTASLDDFEVITDLRRHAFDFGDLKRVNGPPVTVYLIIPPDMMERHAKWLRLLLTAAINAVMRPRQYGEPRVLFMLDEFAALGHLEIVSTVWALVRGYGVQIMPVLQNLTQLQRLYGDKGANEFIAQAGVISSFGTNDDATAEWLSKRAGKKSAVIMGYGQNMTQGGQGTGQSSGPNWHESEVKALRTELLYGLKQGMMINYFDGVAPFVPSYAPAYWEVPDWNARARSNPLALHASGQGGARGNPWALN